MRMRRYIPLSLVMGFTCSWQQVLIAHLACCSVFRAAGSAVQVTLLFLLQTSLSIPSSSPGPSHSTRQAAPPAAMNFNKLTSMLLCALLAVMSGAVAQVNTAQATALAQVRLQLRAARGLNHPAAFCD